MLKNGVALITGGASGLGKATVERFLKNGLKIAILDLETSEGQNVATSLGDDVLFVPADISNEVHVEHAFDAIKEKFGRLDVLVNCAGTSCAHAVFNPKNGSTHHLKDFADALNVNNKGTFDVIRTAVKLMHENEPNVDGQRGVIVNTSSTAAFDGHIGQTALATSSGGIVSMTLPLARDLAKIGVRVVTIAPGFFLTPLTSFIAEEALEYLGETTPFPNRLGKPEEFAHLAQAIVENPILNGCTIRLDGGHRLSM